MAVFSEIRNVAIECSTNLDNIELKALVDYQNFLTGTVVKLKPLFIAYGVCYKLDPSIRHCSLHVENFFEDQRQRIILSKTKIQNRIDQINLDLKTKFSEEKIAKTYKLIEKKFPDDVKESAEIICAKKYLMPVLYHHLHRTVHYSGSL